MPGYEKVAEGLVQKIVKDNYGIEEAKMLSLSKVLDEVMKKVDDILEHSTSRIIEKYGIVIRRHAFQIIRDNTASAAIFAAFVIESNTLKEEHEQ